MNNKSQIEILGIEPFSPKLTVRRASIKCKYSECDAIIGVNNSDTTSVVVHYSDDKYEKLGNMIDCTLPDGKNFGQLEVGDILFCNIATGKIE